VVSFFLLVLLIFEGGCGGVVVVLSVRAGFRGS